MKAKTSPPRVAYRTVSSQCDPQEIADVQERLTRTGRWRGPSPTDSRSDDTKALDPSRRPVTFFAKGLARLGGVGTTRRTPQRDRENGMLDPCASSGRFAEAVATRAVPLTRLLTLGNVGGRAPNRVAPRTVDMGPNLTGANRAKRHRVALGGRCVGYADILRKVRCSYAISSTGLWPTTQGVR